MADGNLEQTDKQNVHVGSSYVIDDILVPHILQLWYLLCCLTIDCLVLGMTWAASIPLFGLCGGQLTRNPQACCRDMFGEAIQLIPGLEIPLSFFGSFL